MSIRHHYYLSAFAAVAFGLAAGTSAPVRADDVRYTEENGVTYCQTRVVVKRPITETHYEQRQQTVYTQQYKTQTQTLQRTYQIPITEYYTETYWVNRWNPFAEPYLASRYVPRTRWETRTDQVQVPIVRAEWVPQQQTVKVPVTTQRFVDEEHTSKVVVAVRPTGDPFAQPGAAQAPVAQGPTVQTPGALAPIAQAPVAQAPPSAAGGVHLDSDPPRSSTAWHPADQAVQR